MTRAATGVLNPEQQNENGNGNGAHEGTIISQGLNYEDEAITSAKFMQRLVPFYAKCLIEVSAFTFLYDFVVVQEGGGWSKTGLVRSILSLLQARVKLFQSLQCLPNAISFPDLYRILERES